MVFEGEHAAALLSLGEAAFDAVDARLEAFHIGVTGEHGLGYRGWP